MLMLIRINTFKTVVFKVEIKLVPSKCSSLQLVNPSHHEKQLAMKEICTLKKAPVFKHAVLEKDI